MNPSFEIRELESHGKVLIATRDILPGTEVFSDDNPVLSFTDEFLSIYTGDEWPRKFCATYSTFTKHTSPDNQARYLTLFAPKDGFMTEQLYELAKGMMINADTDEPRQLTHAEQEQCVRICNIFKFNAFHGNGRHLVYEIITRMSHSCMPNCHIDFDGKAAICRATRGDVAGVATI